MKVGGIVLPKRVSANSAAVKKESIVASPARNDSVVPPVGDSAPAGELGTAKQPTDPTPLPEGAPTVSANGNPVNSDGDTGNASATTDAVGAAPPDAPTIAQVDIFARNDELPLSWKTQGYVPTVSLHKRWFPHRVNRRFQGISAIADENESIFYIGNHTIRYCIWSSAKVKDSRLIVRGNVTPVKFLCIGQISWNGLLPDHDGKWPTRPKISVKPLRAKDLMGFRQIIETKSCSGTYSLVSIRPRVSNVRQSANEIDTGNIESISAHTDNANCIRGSNEVQVSDTIRLFD